MTDGQEFAVTTTIELQGRLVRVGVARRGRCGIGGLRGVIGEFSQGSRRRLMQRLARVDFQEGRWSFVTMTYPPECRRASRREVYRDFVLLARRIERSLGYECAGVWRVERQECGAWHMHALMQIPFIAQRWLALRWGEVIGSERVPVVDIREVRDVKAVVAYVCKYLGKVGESQCATGAAAGGDPRAPGSLDISAYCDAVGAGGDTGGRWWGVWRRASLPFAEKLCVSIVGECAGAVAHRLRRWVVRVWRGRCGAPLVGASAYVSNALEWCRVVELALYQCGLDYDAGGVTVEYG